MPTNQNPEHRRIEINLDAADMINLARLGQSYQPMATLLVDNHREGTTLDTTTILRRCLQIGADEITRKIHNPRRRAVELMEIAALMRSRKVGCSVRR